MLWFHLKKYALKMCIKNQQNALNSTDVFLL